MNNKDINITKLGYLIDHCQSIHIFKLNTALCTVLKVRGIEKNGFLLLIIVNILCPPLVLILEIRETSKACININNTN